MSTGLDCSPGLYVGSVCNDSAHDATVVALVNLAYTFFQLALRSNVLWRYTESVGGFCGNWRVEGEEECDAGRDGDSCCDSSCRLTRGSICRCLFADIRPSHFLTHLQDGGMAQWL